MRYCAILVLLLTAAMPLAAQTKHEISISGSCFMVNGSPFPFTGISFYNAIYNPSFNKSSEDRQRWMKKFQQYGVNVLRIFSQWDMREPWIDTCPECSLFHPDGRLREKNIARLKEILADADAVGMVVQLELFQHVAWTEGRFGATEAERGKVIERLLPALTRELLPYRNLTFQMWGEMTFRTVEYTKLIKATDRKRLVTNSPGGSSVLGTREENEALDYLAPHTTRQNRGRHWEIAPREVAYLIARYSKPVVDDEPARNGTQKFGGPPDAQTTYPYDQILQIYEIWRAGGYITYHHDMFQTGYGTPPIPPSGIPDPEFSPYHRTVLDFLSHRERYQPQGCPAIR
jgi:hypothetical protein